MSKYKTTDKRTDISDMKYEIRSIKRIGNTKIRITTKTYIRQNTVEDFKLIKVESLNRRTNATLVINYSYALDAINVIDYSFKTLYTRDNHTVETDTTLFKPGFRTKRTSIFKPKDGDTHAQQSRSTTVYGLSNEVDSLKFYAISVSDTCVECIKFLEDDTKVKYYYYYDSSASQPIILGAAKLDEANKVANISGTVIDFKNLKAKAKPGSTASFEKSNLLKIDKTYIISKYPFKDMDFHTTTSAIIKYLISSSHYDAGNTFHNIEFLEDAPLKPLEVLKLMRSASLNSEDAAEQLLAERDFKIKYGVYESYSSEDERVWRLS